MCCQVLLRLALCDTGVSSGRLHSALRGHGAGSRAWGSLICSGWGADCRLIRAGCRFLCIPLVPPVSVPAPPPPAFQQVWGRPRLLLLGPSGRPSSRQRVLDCQAGPWPGCLAAAWGGLPAVPGDAGPASLLGVSGHRAGNQLCGLSGAPWHLPGSIALMIGALSWLPLQCWPGLLGWWVAPSARPPAALLPLDCLSLGWRDVGTSW